MEDPIEWIVSAGIHGFSFLPSAEEVAEHHLRACGGHLNSING